MKSNLISKNETADTLREISEQWGFEVPRSKNLRVHHLEDGVLLIESPQLKALKIDGSMIPFLTGTDILAKFPHAVVDMGAVKFMCNGANVMRPGIVEYSEFSKGDIVCIVEESQRKAPSGGQGRCRQLRAGRDEEGRGGEEPALRIGPVLGDRKDHLQITRASSVPAPKRHIRLPAHAPWHPQAPSPPGQKPFRTARLRYSPVWRPHTYPPAGWRRWKWFGAKMECG